MLAEVTDTMTHCNSRSTRFVVINARIIVPIISVCVMLALMLLATGVFYMWKRSQGEVVIEYVIPNGFRGIIFIVESPSAAAPIVERSRNETTYTYFVSNDGRLVVRSEEPMDLWHHTRSRYRDGQKLPARGFDVVAEDDVALVEISGNAILVGTVQDEKDYWRRQGYGPPIVSPGPLRDERGQKTETNREN